MCCPCCRSEKVSEAVDYGGAGETARFRDWEQGFLQWRDLLVRPARARVCLACGHMMVFASEEDLATLRAGRPE